MTDRKPIHGRSHVIGATNDPLLEMTIPALLAETVAAWPDREAAIFPKQNIRWTWTEFAVEVDRLAAGLLALGVAKGDRVSIWAPNRVEWLLTQFATARIGSILVCINPAYRKSELEYALNKVGCSTLIMAAAFKTSDYVGMIQDLAPEMATSAPGALNAAALPHLRNVIVTGDAPAGAYRFDQVTEMGSAERATLDSISTGLDPDDAINIQFTSGTTGSPKGACLSHRNIVNNAHFVTSTMAFSEQDRLCIPVPFYHCFGMVMGTLGCATKGAAMIVPGEGFDPAETLQAVSDESCTALFGVPTMFVTELALDNFDSYDLSNLRTGIMAGAPCPEQVMKEVLAKMNMSEVTIAYGMTETSPVSFQTNVDDPMSMRTSTVGRIHPHVECKVIDETGAETPAGVQGELLTRGYSVMKGYWGEEEKTAASIDSDGWMHSGDLAVIDENGFCNITGRVKDMICRGGENIYPREVEEFLFTHPAIAQAQVFGVPDQKFGEIACAWLVLHQGTEIDEAEVKAFCKENIAYYKIPAHIRFKDELPMTVTGKPQKFIMSDQMAAELGAAHSVHYKTPLVISKTGR